MACASQSIISVSSCAFSRQRFMQKLKKTRKYNSLLFVRASSSTDEDCNSVECAPDKEVGKVSVEWLAEEKTKVIGTFPPRRKGWTGYVEKDTAGQTNIYSVEPAVYVAESAISSGNAGTSSEGSQNTVAVVASIALIAIAAASTILLQLGKDLPQVKTTQYSGPSLSYYINKFKPVVVIEAATPAESQNAPATVSSETSSPQAPQVEVESQSVPAVSSSDNSS